jgi:hypothetical protein
LTDKNIIAVKSRAKAQLEPQSKTRSGIAGYVFAYSEVGLDDRMLYAKMFSGVYHSLVDFSSLTNI